MSKKDVVNRRGHIRRALFDQLEREHLFLPQRLLFDACMQRDYKRGVYYAISDDRKKKVLPSSFNILLMGELGYWFWMHDENYINLIDYRAAVTFRYGHVQEGHVHYALLVRGREYIQEKALLMNRLISEKLGHHAEVDALDSLRAEVQILGLDVMERYIRFK